MKKIVEVTSENFEQEVTRAGTPVLVDFSATWCGPCKMLAPILESVAPEFEGRIKFAKLDVDEEPELAARYRITGVPTLMIFRNGQVTQTMVGLSSVITLRDWLEKAAASQTAIQE